MSTTFKVSNVDYATQPLPQTEGSQILQSYAPGPSCEAFGISNPHLLSLPSSTHGPSRLHPVLDAAHRAFDDHRPLSLSPDHIWLLITQGFAMHVKENAETLRKQFVQHDGQTLIEIKRDQFIKGSPNNDWVGCFGEFSERIKDHIGKKQDLLVANFTTTGVVEKACSEVVLMDAMSTYFKYQVTTRCGIPQITLEGTPEDWASIKDRTAVLGEFGLSWWVDTLLPVLEQFVQASMGYVDRDFWGHFYKLNSMSGGPWVTGWINTLFPYLSTSEGWEQNKYASCWEKKPLFGGGPKPGHFPNSGLSKVDFIWDYLGTKLPMEFLAGFVGVSQEGITLRPEFGWGVRDKD